MTEQDKQSQQQNPPSEGQQKEESTGDRGNQSGGQEQHEGLTHEQIMEAIAGGEFDVDSLIDPARFVTKDRMEEVIKERLDRDRKEREEAAQTEALKEQQKYKELYEKEQTKAQELEPYKADAEKYKGALQKELEARMEGVPDHIKSLLKDRDPVDQLSWLTENREALGSSTNDSTSTRGVPPTPPASKPGEPTQEQKEANRARATRQYRTAF